MTIINNTPGVGLTGYTGPTGTGGKTYSLPKEWVQSTDYLTTGYQELFSTSRYWNPDYYVFFKTDAELICKKYIETIDETQWPLLMGQSEIMDQILGEKFRI